jgi:hypothetical protein
MSSNYHFVDFFSSIIPKIVYDVSEIILGEPKNLGTHIVVLYSFKDNPQKTLRYEIPIKQLVLC